jgi:hypothetical protein
MIISDQSDITVPLPSYDSDTPDDSEQRTNDLITDLHGITLTDSNDADIVQSSQNNAPLKVKLIIHHQFPGVELTLPVYACENATCHLSPDQSLDVGSMMQAGFSIGPTQDKSIGALICKLQRKNIDQSNEEVISNEEEETCIQLAIIWEVDSSKEFQIALFLIEHDKDRVWDRDGLMELVKWFALLNIQHSPIENTYLMHDNTVLMMRVNVACEEEYYKLEIILSEGSLNKDTRRSWYIGLNR